MDNGCTCGNTIGTIISADPNPVLIKGLAAAATTGGLCLGGALWTVVRRGSPQAQTPSRCRLRPLPFTEAVFGAAKPTQVNALSAQNKTSGTGRVGSLQRAYHQ